MSSESETITYTRVCRRCSAQSTTDGDTCPSCGASFVRRSWRPSKRLLVVGLVVLLVGGGGVAGLLVKQGQDAAEADRAAAAIERAAAEREAADAKAQEAADQSERDVRASAVVELEETITKDAKENVDDGILEGPILRSSCTATGGGSTDDLTALTGTFECLAVNEELDDGMSSGYRYSATIDWQSGSYTWRLGG